MGKTTERHIGNIFVFGAFLISMILFASYSEAASNNPEIPKIISRAEWGADESQMTWPIEYAPVEKIIVHHTANKTLVPDTDGSGEYKGMVRNLYNYFTNSKEWKDGSGAVYIGYGDMGYNYIIDPNGNIYEGRKGGNGVVGGHAIGFNNGSVGISIIGNYQDGDPGQTNTILEPQVQEALEKLVGWIAANNGIDLDETSVFYGKKIDGMVGHKDVYNTSCPGTVIYAKLDSIQEEAIEYAKSYEDYAYQVKGDTAVYVISGGYKIKFSSRDDMPSSYRNREIHYISRAQLNAYQYKDMRILPDGTLIQKDGEGTVYYIEDGKKRPLSMTEEQFLRLGFKSSEVVSLSDMEMDFYENGQLIKYGPDGKLIKGSDNNVYFVENGKKRRFTSATLFVKLGYSWSKINQDAAIGSYLEGDVMRYPTGTLLRSANSPSVYYIENESKRLFTSGALFERLGFKWGNILTVDALELNWYPSAGNMIYPDKTLIRGAGTPTVYLVEGGKKREITSATLLFKLGYTFAGVVEIPAENLDDYPTGAKASYPDGTLVKAADNPAVYRINAGTRQEFTSLGVFEANGAKWGNVVEISRDEINLYPISGIVKYPDGTLLRSEGGDKVYIIKGGSAVWIKTAEEFVAAGYKWSSIRVISPAEMALYVSPVATLPADEEEEDDNADTDKPAKEDATDEDTLDDSGSSNADTASKEPNIRIAIVGKYADGCLLKATGDSKIYVIKGGVPALINSPAEFEAAGYDWNDVVTIDPKDMAVVLSSNADNTKITANGSYTVEYHRANGEIYKTVQKAKDQVTEVPFFDWDNYIRFVPQSDNVIMQVLSYNDVYKSGTVTYNDNQFRGVLEMRYSPVSKKLWVIEDVPLEGYLRGISEATTRTNAEYLKAFSVITRTYAMYYIEKGGKHAGEPFHLKNSRNGNGNDQQYKGYTFEMRSPSTAGSYGQTTGQVIEFKGKLIVAAYSSDSGGVTKSGCEVLSKNYCTSDYDYLDGGVTDPAATVHNPSAVAASHGAGMSAAGAYQMAQEGSDWQSIIKHYYLGVDIDKRY
jgi:peptidoglycan hydrolase-like amidase